MSESRSEKNVKSLSKICNVVFCVNCALTAIWVWCYPYLRIREIDFGIIVIILWITLFLFIENKRVIQYKKESLKKQFFEIISDILAIAGIISLLIFTVAFTKCVYECIFHPLPGDCNAPFWYAIPNATRDIFHNSKRVFFVPFLVGIALTKDDSDKK